MRNGLLLSVGVAAASRRRLDSDDLKAVVRDAMILMDQAERKRLITDLETELNQAGRSMRSHLIQLGIPTKNLCELTPNEVGHFIRFIDITSPQLMPAIERALSRYPAFSREEAPLASCPAA